MTRAPERIRAESAFDRFARVAAANASRPALTEGAVTITYEELREGAARKAVRLLDAGLGPGDRLALWSESSRACIETILGAASVGIAYVPLDARAPFSRLRYVADDASVKAVAARCAPHEELTELGRPLLDLDAAASSRGSAPASATASTHDELYVIYTSGSTGSPKGVSVTNGNLMRLFDATEELFQFGPDDVWTMAHSIAFDFSVWEMWGALTSGGRLVVVPYAVSADPGAFSRLVVDERVTILNQTPTAFRRLLGEARRAGFPETNLRIVVFGGEPLDPRMLGPWFGAYGDEKPHVFNMYGITETTVHVTVRRLLAEDARAQWSHSPIGIPLRDLEVQLVDEDGQLVEGEGRVGEMVVRGAGVAAGYVNDPAATAERFSFHPPRAYRSGDLAMRVDGELLFVGRNDRQLKIRGYRVEPAEIEAALRSLDEVEDAVVLAQGEGDERTLAAFVVAATGAHVHERDALKALAAVLPEYLLPQSIATVESWPLTANGKLDDEALLRVADRAESPPKIDLAGAGADERLLQDVYEHVLDIPDLGLDDNFFALGGNSISALRVVSEAAARGLELELADVIQGKTVAGVLERRRSREGDASTVQLPELRHPSGELPEGAERVRYASWLQLGLIFHSEASDDPSLYHDLVGFRVGLPLDEVAFERAVATVVGRHEVLRSSFDLTSFDEPAQIIWRDCFPSRICEFSSRSSEPPSTAEWRERERRRTLSWREPPLVRIYVSDVDEAGFDVTLAVHHAIVDGWSLSIVVNDLVAAYAAELAGGTPELRAGRSSDAFLAAERASAANPAAAAFWKGRAAQAGPLLSAKPAANPESWVVRDLAPWLVPLRAAAREAGVTVKSMALALHASALMEMCDRDVVTTGVVMNGRVEAEADTVAGLFVNALPFTFTGQADWWSLAADADSAEREAYDHRHFPLALIERAIGRPAFDVLFNYTHFADGQASGVAFDWWSWDKSSYALTAEFMIESRDFGTSVGVRYDPHVIGDASVTRYVDALFSLLDELPDRS